MLPAVSKELEDALDDAPDLVVVLDRGGRVCRANKALARRLGLTPGGCEGSAGSSCMAWGGRSGGPLELTLEDGLPHTAELRDERLGGDFLVTTLPLTDAAGAVIGALSVATELSQKALTRV